MNNPNPHALTFAQACDITRPYFSASELTPHVIFTQPPKPSVPRIAVDDVRGRVMSCVLDGPDDRPEFDVAGYRVIISGKLDLSRSEAMELLPERDWLAAERMAEDALWADHDGPSYRARGKEAP